MAKNAKPTDWDADRLALLERALDAAPLDASAYRALATARRLGGDELGALAHSIAAQTVEAHAAGSLTDSGFGLCNVATGYFMKGEHETAARWYRLVLMINPNLASAHQNLAAIHADAGRVGQAQFCRDRAYQIQRVFIESAGNRTRRVLILCVGRTAGNTPPETLLPAQTCCRIKYVIDYAAEEEDARLPPFDLVFNAIGEPDVAAPLQDRLERFARGCGRPLLNPPQAVARTQRQQLPALLGEIEGAVAAPCIVAGAPSSVAAVAAQVATAGIHFPLLVRPAASHGGAGLVRCENIEELACHLRGCHGPAYVSAFCDTRSADGYYRKYRIIFVDREPFAYHLAISSHWMVHYFSADMEVSPWRIAEERRFLDDPGAALGARAMAAIAAIGRALDLDYGGIDFALLPDGRVFVFEANATMLVHRERHNGVLVHKNCQVQRIVDAFERLQERRLGAAADGLSAAAAPIEPAPP